MDSQWNELEAKKYSNNDVELRAYTSRLLGREPSLVLHGGGNTSVKGQVRNVFGENVDVLFVKGSGWDLASIEPAGFAPVKMDVLCRMANLESLSDTDMVREQKAAMTNPSAPNPSVEAILHAIIPFRFVDHTHADAVVTLTNTPAGEKIVREIYGNRVLYIPYVMPGFVLARKIYEMTRDVNWQKLEGLVLLNHGVFTFSDDAKTSYENMLKLVTEAEKYLQAKGLWQKQAIGAGKSNPLQLAELRSQVAKSLGTAVIASLDKSPEACGFANIPNIEEVMAKGTVTPDHVIHTKPKPLVFNGAASECLQKFSLDYKNYFERNQKPGLTCLDLAPRWAIWPEHGVVAFAKQFKTAKVILDIQRHTRQCVQWGMALGGWQPVCEADLFEVEYWELEQAKIKNKTNVLPLQGKIALVTGAASGIGKACVEQLLAQGAAVGAFDINPAVKEIFKAKEVFPYVCDVTDEAVMFKGLEELVERFGGLDILVSNAGYFSQGAMIESIRNEDWDKSILLNLTSHERLLKMATPYLRLGIEASVVFVASKNVPAPGPGAAAYSVAKAGLAQLARVAALELAASGVRVNTLHPDAVFDTGVWTNEVLQSRAKHYGLTVDQYKKKNLLKTEITSKDVADLVVAMSSRPFAKTTGAQIPIDGGNDRVI